MIRNAAAVAADGIRRRITRGDSSAEPPGPKRRGTGDGSAMSGISSTFITPIADDGPEEPADAGDPVLEEEFVKTKDMRAFLRRLGEEPGEHPESSTQTPGSASLTKSKTLKA